LVTSTRLVLVRASVLAVLATLFLASLGPALATTANYDRKTLPEIRLCRPIVLDLAPLGLTAADSVAFISLGGSALVLPSLPYPVKIVHAQPVILDYLVNNTIPLSRLQPEKILEIIGGIELAKEAAKRLKPLYYNATLLETNPSSQRMLVLLPCSPVHSTAPPRNIAVAGAYSWGGYTLYVARRGTGLEPRYVTTLAPRSLAAFITNTGAERILVTYSFDAYSIAGQELPVIEPTWTRPHPSPSGGQAPQPPSITRISPGPSYYIWDDVPWSSTEIDPYKAWLGDLEGSSGVHVEGGSWSSSDTFYLPPYTVEYSVNLVLHARDYSYAEVKIWLNNTLVMDKTVSLSKGEDTVLEITGNPETPSQDLTPVTYSVSLSGSFNLDIKAVPSAKSMIDSVDEDNLVYTWRHYVIGVPDIQSMPPGSEQEWPPLEIEYGEATLLLQTPLAMVTETPELNITLYSSANTPRSIEISLNGATVCSGTSHQEFYKGAYRQVYQCTATWFTISPLVIESIKEGKPLLLSIKIQGAAEQWYLEPGPVLVAKRRARADLGAQYYQDYLKYAVASYSKNSPFYKIVVVQPLSVTEYVYDTAFSSLKLIYHGVMVLDFARPAYNSNNAIMAKMYTLNGVVLPTYSSSICNNLYTWVNGIDAHISLRDLAQTQLVVPSDSLHAYAIGLDGSVTDDSGIGLFGYITGIASLVLSGAAGAVFGIFSLIASAPSSFYKFSAIQEHGGLTNGASEVYVNASLDTNWDMESTKTGMKLQIEYVVPFGSYTWGSDALISYSGVIRLQHYCSSSGDYGYTVLSFSGSVLDPLING